MRCSARPPCPQQRLRSRIRSRIPPLRPRLSAAPGPRPCLCGGDSPGLGVPGSSSRLKLGMDLRRFFFSKQPGWFILQIILICFNSGAGRCYSGARVHRTRSHFSQEWVSLKTSLDVSEMRIRPAERGDRVVLGCHGQWRLCAPPLKHPIVFSPGVMGRQTCSRTVLSPGKARP